MIKRLRVKFVCINMLIVVIMLSVIFGTVFTMTRKNLEQESIQMMQTVAKNPLQLIRPDENRADLTLPYFSLELDSNGKLRSTGGGFFDLSDDAFLQELVELANRDGGETGVLEEYRLRYCRETTPFAQFLVFADISSEYSTMENLVVNCILIGFGSILVFLGISIALSFWAIKPVEQAWMQQRQFVADASHELKTPLTVILTNAELMQENPDKTFSDNILTMSHKMKGLVESLLELARIDNGIPKEEFEPVDLSRIVDDSVLPFEPMYYEKGLRLSVSLQDGITVKGSPGHLSQVIQILLDNGLKYAPAESEVRLILRESGRKSCLLTVENPGEEIPKEELQSLFKRFYRRDEVRCINGSYGLGLPIAAGIVEKHQGKMWAECRDGNIAFYIQLPMK